ncbi:hypothetical protein JCM33374_g4458 [Metschnikowia sp. JCM 33374]|nr:hypothetical protein JCM33374_g4458 [Metschnikowia sp. JCM 33374]
MSVLPKKRGAKKQAGRGSNTILHDLSNKGRVLTERVLSGAKRRPSGTRHVSRGDMFVTHDDTDANSSFAEDAIHFHENKSTIMSNFEEWIKLSTDNKITSKNSWHFALIDYFHDLNVIKDGDNINFQRASATLDGCVKIYSSRVESAASETGKLLSGLATKRGQLELENMPSDDENEDGTEDPDPTAGKKERKMNRVVESTLVPFEAIQIKKLDQELAIDPLFKKALAEFDEGGAKSLLLNTLNIDSSGRVVFDATTNPMNSKTEETHTEDDASEMPAPGFETETDEPALDLSVLQHILYEETSDLSTYEISPSMNQLKAVLSDVNKARSILTDVNSKFMADEEDERKSLQADDQQSNPDFDLGMDFDDNESPDMGLEKFEEELQNQTSGPTDEETQASQVVSREKVLDSDLMAYFDERMKTNWRGPEHWRVTALKRSKNIGQSTQPLPATSSVDVPKKHKKEQVLIDFFAEEDDEMIEEIFRKSKNQYQISKRPEERKSETSHILPEDMQFNSQKLVNLFLKPNKTIVTFSKKAKSLASSGLREDGELNAYTDEQYFADKYQEREKDMAEEERQEKLALSFHQAELEDCDNDNYGGLDFNDILDGGDGPLQEDLGESKDDLGSQIFAGTRKARPEYVNYSRVAKRVDIKLLKDNLWKSIKIEEEESEKEKPRDSETPEPQLGEDSKQKSFKEVVDVIGTMYRPEEKKDLSTSFCFICLLHLANEHGLSINSTELNDNLVITGF